VARHGAAGRLDLARGESIIPYSLLFGSPTIQ
jgi:hypothetical protein